MSRQREMASDIVASGISDHDRNMETDVMEHESLDAFEGFENDTDTDKDSTELELEKAVFGDEAGFYQRLKEHGLTGDDPQQPIAIQREVRDEIEEDIQDIRDVDDADVCYAAAPVMLPSDRSFSPSYSSLTLDPL